MWFPKRIGSLGAARLRLSKFVPVRTFAEEAKNDKPARAQPITDEFRKSWKAVAPMLDIPRIPTNFLGSRPPVPATLPTKLTVNFMLPQRFELEEKQVDMVIIPAKSGLMGVLPGHVPTIAELKPGILTVHEGTEVKKYVVSGGYAFVHANSTTDIVTVEAVLVENLDSEEGKKGLAEYTQKLSSATTDLAKAEAQIAIEVYGNVVAALS